MARLWSSGLELNSLTANVELTASAGTPAIGTSVIRSGTYSLTFDTSGGAAVKSATYQYSASDLTAPIYYRIYLRVADDPSVTTYILKTLDSGPIGNQIGIKLNTDLTLELWNNEDAAQIGSDSSALSLNTWYRIELKVDSTTIASTAVEAKIDGTTFASGTANLARGQGQLRVGMLGDAAAAAGILYIDDIAINDSTGSFQNSWPGEGEIIHLRPNADGDNTAWSGDYTSVDEVTPDGNTSTTGGSTTIDTIEEYNLDATPAALASDDTINCVQVGVNYKATSTTGTTPRFILRIKSASGGTVEEGTEIITNSTSYNTNANAVPRNYNLTLYDLPGASTTSWTKSDLDTTQIGVRTTNNPTTEAVVTTMWLLVDHKPGEAGGGGTTQTTGFMTTRTGFWGD